MKEIYLAGGCFWGVEAYYKRIDGVVDTEVGYANSRLKSPSYKEVCTGRTDAAETVKIVYDEEKITLEDILKALFKVIDPTLINRQGPDIGSQYRSGIYYTDEGDRETIEKFIENVKGDYKMPIATEVMKLENFYEAEDYHQDYLDKNPDGYCHIKL